MRTRKPAVKKSIIERSRPSYAEVTAILRDERAEWLAHGNCKHTYEFHRLAMEVRYLQADLVVAARDWHAPRSR